MAMQDLEPIRKASSAGFVMPGAPGVGGQRASVGAPGSSWGGKRDYSGVLEYWHMVRRHQTAVAVAVVLGGIWGFCNTLSEPRIYQAHATIEIQAMNDNFLDLKALTPTSDSTSMMSDSDIQTQVRIIQSGSVIRRVMDKMRARPHPANLPLTDRLSAWRQALGIKTPSNDDLWQEALGSAAGGLRVHSSPLNRIVDLTCDSTSGAVAADFLNTLAEEYIEQNRETRWKSTEETGAWLTDQLRDLRVRLEKAQDELQGYVVGHGLVVTDEKSNVNQAKLQDLQRELSAAQSDRVSKQSVWEVASSSPIDSLPAILDDATLQTQVQAVQDLKKTVAQLKVIYTPNHPEVRKVEAQVAALEGPLMQQRQDILQRIKNEYDASARREKMLTEFYDSQAHVVSGQTAEMDRYSFLKREADATRTLYESMQQKMKEASIASAMRASNIHVVDKADTPFVPYRPDVPRSTFVGLLTGLILGVAYAVSRERADRTLQDPGDAEHYLKVAELGVIPLGRLDEPISSRLEGVADVMGHESGNGGSSAAPSSGVELQMHNSRTSLIAESFRTTLTSILFSGGFMDRPPVLVVTSASPKEGKTTVVCNLAIAFAEVQSRVLLVDCDMRRPRLHTVFRIENGPGLSDLLAQRESITLADVEELVQPTGVPGLSLLTSGKSRYKVSTLLYSSRLPELLQLLRGHFDTVVFDTPPMVNIADARLVGRYADGVIMVVRSMYTTRDAALLARQRLQEDGTRLLGMILNGWDPSVPGYSYYRNYYAGYHHYYGPESPNYVPSEKEKARARKKKRVD
jgi:succinoglycan biosynthesis transport protein ExoP